MLTMKRIKTELQLMLGILLAFGILLALAFTYQPVVGANQQYEVNIYFFWGEGCPHCAAAKPVLEQIAAENPQVTYFDFEVYNHPENVELFYAFANAYNLQPQYVPTIFVAERYWEGYSEAIGAEIQATIDRCLVEGCDDPGKAVLQELRPDLIPPSQEPTQTAQPALPMPTPTDEPGTATEISPTPEVVPTEENDNPGSGSISLPFFGTVDLTERSLFLSTLLIAFVDGFNPCSVWVLSMLLAITLNTRSRKKVLIIGLVFIFVTGLVYALFIAGLFTVLKVVSFIGWIQLVVSLVALFFGLINIKDYFWYKEGLSFTISDEKKPGIYKGIRRVLQADQNIWVLIGSTIVLAAGVSLVEFSCTAGFPVLWTNLLATQDVSNLAFIGFLLLYMLVYQIDELGIFLVSVFTLRKTKLEEKHGRILKLLGGMLMLTLSAVMLINPALMNNILNALIIFGAAFGLTGLVLLIHRVILPKFNIRIGSKD